jgi:hypothetical protein
MLLLVLKLVLAPLLVAAASLAQRRFGPTIGGRLVGLPLTATPMLVLLALSEGSRFTAHVAVADQSGDVAASAWCLAYALAARRLRPAAALAAASGAFAAVAVGLGQVHLGLLAATVVASAALIGTLLCWPRPAGDAVAAPTREPERPELGMRMLAAAVFTFATTESAAALGSTAAGLLGAVPLVTVVLTVATHRRDGAAATNRFLQGVMAGSFSVIGFLAVVALTLPTLGTAPAFSLGLLTSVVAQAAGGRRAQQVGSRLRARLRPAPRTATA